ncbi:UV radiation resistance protein/autophagy-related protein 14 [Metarhizium album ARSEF 1941]|uniref:Autophagy-related protein 14 n=1 Tax=Metarhizium album (strain ARSEF 1941) TaxID=1081103 RepID=A0A0B2WRR7_METAS|nr:UV radiation resistance protein/autophagy-related protein 14 [Metarhizium album ARSEF 1941]KHN96718.1 UV radiation resistance protein/autophagy-related protein 14 [Metarhizium album ARSEF 1941]
MECDICHRDHDAQKLPFLCAFDARNSLYELRINSLEALLENESLQGQVNEFYAKSSKNSHGDIEQCAATRHMEEDRTDEILASANKLNEEIQAAREEIRTRKAALSRRRSDLASASGGLAERRVKQQQELDKSAQVARFRWAQRAEATANTRAFLCTQAIRLYGLKRTKKAGSARYEYQLGRVPIIDLVAMDSYTPEVISTSLAHVTHILMLAHDFHPINVKVPGWGPNGEEVEEESQGNWLGRFSHGATFYFLGGHEGTELIRSLKLPSPMKLADRLKKKLVGDAPAPDWEILDDDAWKIEDLPGADSGATSAQNVLDKSTHAKSTPRSGTNGWTKVKHR